MDSIEPSQFNVLVIEDNEHFRLLTRTVLQSAGIRAIREARDGVEALEALREEPADLVLLDWKMEPMDGLVFVSRVRRSPASPDPFVPVLMVSAYLDAELVREAYDAGVDACIAKPITAKGLLSRISDLMKHRRPFVRTETYFGPDRRRADLPFQGPERRVTPCEPIRPPARPLRWRS